MLEQTSDVSILLLFYKWDSIILWTQTFCCYRAEIKQYGGLSFGSQKTQPLAHICLKLQLWGLELHALPPPLPNAVPGDLAPQRKLSSSSLGCHHTWSIFPQELSWVCTVNGEGRSCVGSSRKRKGTGTMFKLGLHSGEVKSWFFSMLHLEKGESSLPSSASQMGDGM